MKDYKTFGIELAQEAGKIMRKNFTLGMEKEWKSNNTPLTVSDTAINRLVVEKVQEYYPGHNVIGEEESNLGDSDYIWVCDPLDGTIPFSHGIPTSVFSLALTHQGKPIFGVIHDPFMHRLLVAEQGKGASLNEKKIIVSSQTELYRGVMSFEGLNSPLMDDISDQIVAFSKKGAKVLILGSYVYGGMLVASGELIAAVFAHKSPWDTAALKIIVEEAGGKCTDLHGNDQLYNKEVNGFIASNGLVHEKVLEILNS